MNRLLTIAALAALSALPGWGLDTSKLKPSGYVNDFANVLGAGKQPLEEYAANLERATGVQMAIVVVPALDDEPIEDVANRLYREWGIGQKGKNEGILLLLSMKEHKSRAEIGYGLEPIITDGDAGGILRSIVPILRQGNYAGGLLAAAQEIGRQIAQAKDVALGGGEPERPVGRRAVRGPSIPFPLILIGIFILFSLLNRGGRGGGSGTGFLTGMILGNMMGRGGGNWGGGGFGGGNSGGGGGFGGFGGGDSGGGGASGNW